MLNVTSLLCVPPFVERAPLEAVSALGDGTPTRAHSLAAIYTVDSRAKVEISKANEKGRSPIAGAGNNGWRHHVS